MACASINSFENENQEMTEGERKLPSNLSSEKEQVGENEAIRDDNIDFLDCYDCAHEIGTPLGENLNLSILCSTVGLSLLPSTSHAVDAVANRAYPIHLMMDLKLNHMSVAEFSKHIVEKHFVEYIARLMNLDSTLHAAADGIILLSFGQGYSILVFLNNPIVNLYRRRLFSVMFHMRIGGLRNQPLVASGNLVEHVCFGIKLRLEDVLLEKPKETVSPILINCYLTPSEAMGGLSQQNPLILQRLSCYELETTLSGSNELEVRSCRRNQASAVELAKALLQDKTQGRFKIKKQPNNGKGKPRKATDSRIPKRKTTTTNASKKKMPINDEGHTMLAAAGLSFRPNTVHHKKKPRTSIESELENGHSVAAAQDFLRSRHKGRNTMANTDLLIDEVIEKNPTNATPTTKSKLKASDQTRIMRESSMSMNEDSECLEPDLISARTTTASTTSQANTNLTTKSKFGTSGFSSSRVPKRKTEPREVSNNSTLIGDFMVQVQEPAEIWNLPSDDEIHLGKRKTEINKLSTGAGKKTSNQSKAERPGRNSSRASGTKGKFKEHDTRDIGHQSTVNSNALNSSTGKKPSSGAMSKQTAAQSKTGQVSRRKGRTKACATRDIPQDPEQSKPRANNMIDTIKHIPAVEAVVEPNDLVDPTEIDLSTKHPEERKSLARKTTKVPTKLKAGLEWIDNSLASRREHTPKEADTGEIVQERFKKNRPNSFNSIVDTTENVREVDESRVAGNWNVDRARSTLAGKKKITSTAPSKKDTAVAPKSKSKKSGFTSSQSGNVRLEEDESRDKEQDLEQSVAGSASDVYSIGGDLEHLPELADVWDHRHRNEAMAGKGVLDEFDAGDIPQDPGSDEEESHLHANYSKAKKRKSIAGIQSPGGKRRKNLEKANDSAASTKTVKKKSRASPIPKNVARASAINVLKKNQNVDESEPFDEKDVFVVPNRCFYYPYCDSSSKVCHGTKEGACHNVRSGLVVIPEDWDEFLEVKSQGKLVQRGARRRQARTLQAEP